MQLLRSTLDVKLALARFTLDPRYAVGEVGYGQRLWDSWLLYTSFFSADTENMQAGVEE